MKIAVFTLVLPILVFTSCTSVQTDSITNRQTIQRPPAMTELEANPFLHPSSLPFQTPDFDKITVDHYLPAFEEGIRREIEEIETIAENPDEPTFQNTIEAMERSGGLLTRVSRVFYNMTSAHTDEEIQEIQSELAPKLAAHSDNILLNPELFERVEELYNRREELDLDPESDRLLYVTYRNFIRAGAQLSPEEQDRMRQINERLSTLTTRFQENLLEMTRERAVIIDQEEELAGLSSGRIAAAREAAEERGYDNRYLLTITNTTRQPVLESLENRETRQRVWEASAYRGTGEEGGVDNRPLILEIVRLRAEKAELLGHPHWASYAIDTNAAGTPENAIEMMSGLTPAVLANSSREAEQIREQMRQDGLNGEPEPWDWEYYAERVRSAEYDIDEDEVRPYFELERVLHDGVFYTMNRLFGITFQERTDLPVYHPDVRVFDVIDENGTQIGLFYGDYFARDSKRGGAWMSSFVVQSHLLDNGPVIVNVLNNPKPAEGEPALISFDNVTTLFHEIGHAVHGLFSDVRYPSLAGTSVPRDFVEFPSTFEEDWAIHPEVLENYAVHYETGRQIPRDLLDRLIEAREFNQGFDTQEYLAAAFLDMEWHTLTTDEIPNSVEDFEEAALNRHNLLVHAIPPRYKSTFFSHIFAGGYSANYYAYIWSEIMAADAFAYMRSNGGLTRENGDHFRETILSRGGSREAMELYHEFRGEDPEVIHLLRRRGLENENGSEN